MGIKGLNKLISQYAPTALSQKHVSEFCGSKIAIDSEILMHKFKTIESKNSHIFGFLNNIFWHLENGIEPIYVFDGAPNSAKQTNALTKRFTYKEQMYRKVEELENKFVEQLDNMHILETSDSLGHSVLGPEINETLDELFKIQRKMSFMTISKNYRNECKYLLKLMGIPFIVANEDAEALCVALQKRKIVDYVYTEDTDAIPYFIASFIDNESFEGLKILRKGDSIDMLTVIDIGIILHDMELSPKSFIDMCIMCGCDFCPNIPKIGPIRAYTGIKKYLTIEDFGKLSGIIIPLDFKYQEARDIFYKDHSQIVDKSLNLGTLNLEDLKIYLFQERNLNPIPIIDKYNQIFDVYKIKIQSKNNKPSESLQGLSSSVSINKKSGAFNDLITC